MHYSTIVAATLISIAAAAPGAISVRDGLTSAGGKIQPIPADELQRSHVGRRDGLTSAGGKIQPIPADELQRSHVGRRDGLTGAGVSIQPIPADGLHALSKRESRVTYCGRGGKDRQDSGWIPVNDNTHKGWIGYLSAVKAFCYHATHSSDGLPTVIAPESQYSNMISGVTLTSGSVGHVNFLIKNWMKQGTYVISEDECVSYFSEVAKPKFVRGKSTNKCWGGTNQDTLGGIYWVDPMGEYWSMPGTSSG